MAPRLLKRNASLIQFAGELVDGRVGGEAFLFGRHIRRARIRPGHRRCDRDATTRRRPPGREFFDQRPLFGEHRFGQLAGFNQQPAIAFNQVRPRRRLLKLFHITDAVPQRFLGRRTGLGNICVRRLHSQPGRHSAQLGRPVGEIRVKMRHNPVLRRGVQEQHGTVLPPKSQPGGDGSAAAFIQRRGDVQRIPQADNHLQFRQQLSPEGQGDGITRVFPAPNGRFELRNAFGRLLTRPLQLGKVLPLVRKRRHQVPGAAKRFKDAIVVIIKPDVFPIAFRVGGAGRHHVRLQAQVHAAKVQQSGNHGRAGTVHAGDANRQLSLIAH